MLWSFSVNVRIVISLSLLSSALPKKLVFSGIHPCLPCFFYEIVCFFISYMFKCSLSLILFGVSCLSANPTTELAKIEQALKEVRGVELSRVPKVLVYSQASGFAHKSIPTGIKALRELAKKTGAFDPEFSQSVEDFTSKNLNRFDGVIFNNCTRIEKAFSKSQHREALLAFIRQGKGYAGFHGASDAGMPRWNEYTEMVGGCFDGHPWNAGGTWPFIVEDTAHPLCKSFSSRTFRFSDEIYQYKGYDRSKLRVLVSLDSPKSGIQGKSPTKDYPVSWVKAYGKGRVFYSNFGHNKASWWTPFLLKHFLAGIRWSVGDLDGPWTSLPLPESK